MKRFTTLESDIIKENIQAKDRYDILFIDTMSKLDILKKELLIHKSKFESNSKNWGYVGDISHINELISDIIEFINN